MQKEMEKKIRMFSMFYNIIILFENNKIFKDDQLINRVDLTGTSKEGFKIDDLLESLNNGALSASGVLFQLTKSDTCVNNNLCFNGCIPFIKKGKTMTPSMINIEQACQSCKEFVEQGILKLRYLMINDDAVFEDGIIDAGMFNKASNEAKNAKAFYKKYIKMLGTIYRYYLNDSYDDLTKNKDFLENEVTPVIKQMHSDTEEAIERIANLTGNKDDRNFTFNDLQNHGYIKLNTMAKGNMDNLVVPEINSFVTYMSDLSKNTASSDATKYYYRRNKIISHINEQEIEKFKEYISKENKKIKKFKELDIKNIEDMSKKNVAIDDVVEELNIKDIKNKSKLLNNNIDKYKEI